MEEKFWHAEGQGDAKSLPLATKNRLSNNTAPGVLFAAFNLASVKGKSTFGEQEKLKSKKIIDQLFIKGKSVSHNGFTLVYLFAPLQTAYPAQAGFSVPKKFFKHAVDRNRVKRLMREAYRLNKYNLYEKLVAAKKQMACMWIYKGKQLPDYETVLADMNNCMEKLKF